MVKSYELTYIISKNLLPEEANALFEKMLSLCPQAIKKELGYDFFTLEFYAEPETIEELGKKLKTESQIKKYMITKKETMEAVKTRTRTRKMPIQLPIQKQKVEKVGLREIDEKLKEIFGE